MIKLLRLNPDQFDRLHSLLIVLQSFTGLLYLLEVFSVTVQVFLEGEYLYKVFSIGYDLKFLLLFFILIWIILALRIQTNSITFLPILSLLAFPIIGVRVAVILSTLLSICIGVFYFKWTKSILFWSILIGLLWELSSLGNWLIFAPFGIPNPLLRISELDTLLYNISISLGPYLYLVFVFISLFKVYDLMTRRWQINNVDTWISSQKPLFFIIISCLLSILLAIYPTLPGVNEGGGLIGVDTGHYIEEYLPVESSPLNAFKAWEGTRPMIFLVIFCFQKIFNLTPIQAVIYLPTLLNPILIISVYLLGREIFEDNNVVKSSIIFTLFGFQIIVGIYSFFLANILAVSFMNLSLTFLFRTIKNRNWKDLMTSTFLGILLVYTHPWTYTQNIFTIIIFILIAYTKNYNELEKGTYKYFLIYIFITLFFDVTKTLYFISGSLNQLPVYTDNFTTILGFWQDLTVGTRYLYAGTLSNLIILFLSIYGILYFKHDKIMEKYILIMIAVSLILFIPGNEIIKSRLIYNIPFYYLSAYGLSQISKKVEQNNLSIYTYVLIATNALRILSNL